MCLAGLALAWNAVDCAADDAPASRSWGSSWRRSGAPAAASKPAARSKPTGWTRNPAAPPKSVSEPAGKTTIQPTAADSSDAEQIRRELKALLVEYDEGAGDKPAVTDPARDPRQLKSIRDIEPMMPAPSPGQLPEEVSLSTEPYSYREMPFQTYNWEASNLWYYPLYFEDVPQERYGHTLNYTPLQPVLSCAKFSAQAFGLPYQMALNPPWKRTYPLGYYRPGDSVPYKFYQVPLNAEAALFEAGIVVGTLYLIP